MAAKKQKSSAPGRAIRKTVYIRARCSPSLKAKLDAYLSRFEETEATVIRRAVIEFLDRIEQEPKDERN